MIGCSAGNRCHPTDITRHGNQDRSEDEEKSCDEGIKIIIHLKVRWTVEIERNAGNKD